MLKIALGNFVVLAKLFAGTPDDLATPGTYRSGIFCGGDVALKLIIEMVNQSASLRKVIEEINKTAKDNLCDATDKKIVRAELTFFKEDVVYDGRRHRIYEVRVFGFQDSSGKLMPFPEEKKMYTLVPSDEEKPPGP